MYHLFQIKVSKETWENRSVYAEKIFKIRNYSEMTEIDYGEWNELKALWVQEIYKGQLENIIEILKEVEVKQKQMIESLSKF